MTINFPCSIFGMQSSETPFVEESSATFPESILSKLKCYQCEGYLSVFPIYLKASGENVCGNCAILTENKDISTTRNMIYEEVVSSVYFPCRYQNDGCTTNLKPDDLKYHEIGCDFRTTLCPLSQIVNCDYKCKTRNLKEHFEEKHPNYIIKHPYSFQPDFIKDDESFYLMEVFNFMFLVQIKCIKSEAKLWYCVRFVGNPKFAELFNFTIKISNDNESIKKIRRVVSSESLLLSIDKILEFKINSILSVFDNCDALYCNVSVNLKNSKCYICMQNNVKVQIHLDNTGYWCNDCYNKKKRVNCNYCNFEDMQLNMPKHKYINCKFNQNQCNRSNCYTSLSNEGYLEHLKRSHFTPVPQSNKSTYNSLNEFTNTKFNTILKLDEALFLYEWGFYNSKFILEMISSLPKIKTKNYKYVVSLSNNLTNYKIEKEVMPNMLNEKNDLYFEINDDPTKSFLFLYEENGTVKKGCNIEFSIKKNGSY